MFRRMRGSDKNDVHGKRVIPLSHERGRSLDETKVDTLVLKGKYPTIKGMKLIVSDTADCDLQLW
jgi:hypothetical protein